MYSRVTMECSICFQDMTTYTTTPCNHRFHKACITRWAYADEHKDKHLIPCPLCRRDLDMVTLLFGNGMFADVTNALFGDEPFYLDFA